jgi:lysophospholipase L1-like esterase
MPAPRDDNLMERFDEPELRRFGARHAIAAVFLAALLLLLVDGHSVLKAGEEMNPGAGQTIVEAIGRPASSIAKSTPVADAVQDATAFLNPSAPLTGPGFSSAAVGASGPAGDVTPAAFNPSTIGAPAPHRRRLQTLLVTGDSMSEPLDSDLAGDLIPKGVRVVQDPHIGTGISTTFVVNWAQLSAAQVKSDHPEAVVIFIGANDGFPMNGPTGRLVSCCSAQWAAIYANRVRQMANTYRQDGAAHVYWLTLPTPRDPARAQISRVVNAAIAVGVAPWAAQVSVIDTVPIFTPGGVYRDAMKIDGAETIVRQSDGIHLNDAGSQLLAQVVLSAIRRNFTYR